MNIVQITPGAGGMYCGNCFRDNALVGALRQMGEQTLMVPLYLPMTLDEEDNSAGTPIFFGGINVYLEEKSALFRRAPRWIKRVLDHPALLHWAAGRAAKTRASDVGGLTLSMLAGEEGHQAEELTELIRWLHGSTVPDVICLSNALLVGMARRLRQELSVPVVCFLQGEDSFLDALTAPYRERAWALLAERAKDVDLFIAPSRYFGDLMSDRLRLPAHKVRVVHNGIHADGYGGASTGTPPVVGFFARMCLEKGLDTLVDAFLVLQQRPGMKDVRLHVGGSMGPSDSKLVEQLRAKLESQGLSNQVAFFPNVDKKAKQDFYRSLSVLSVPARYGEAFGLYLVEAWASGVPVVQPRVASFPELIGASGGGLLCEPNDPVSLADGLEKVLVNPVLRQKLAADGRAAVAREFTIERMAQRLAELYRELSNRRSPSARPVWTSASPV
ncbi:MAG TPA: glycosyltransferase family 4 protein [Verrucomicrobiae bacterium]|nr:glycosyltransferase family 4 protein [Verrucomicrobiae bacterium]